MEKLLYFIIYKAEIKEQITLYSRHVNPQPWTASNKALQDHTFLTLLCDLYRLNIYFICIPRLFLFIQ